MLENKLFALSIVRVILLLGFLLALIAIIIIFITRNNTPLKDKGVFSAIVYSGVVGIDLYIGYFCNRFSSYFGVII